MFGKVVETLRTFSLLKGLPVYNKANGEMVGVICDLNISHGGQVEGLIIKKKNFFKKKYFVPLEKVTIVEKDIVVIEDNSCLQPLKDEVEYTIEGHRRLSGKMLVTNNGEQLGLLEDVYFLEELGTILGYECSDGFFSDITEGKRVIKTSNPFKFGKDAIIVDMDDSE